jgi:O-glycosyl hydrolase
MKEGRFSRVLGRSVRRLWQVALAIALIFSPWQAGRSDVGGRYAQTDVPENKVDFRAGITRIFGFGFSEAFGEADVLRDLPPERRREILDLLFDRETGAGFNIVRLGIDTGTTIEATDPGVSRASPKYNFDGSDGGQVWLAEQAQKYGVTNFIADAWTAPDFMKTNGKAVGGHLCGLVSTDCHGANWTTAFAEYLLQYVRFYRGLRVFIGWLGFENEPDINVSYDSMLFTPAQAIDFLGVLGPVVRRSGLGLQITCCDASTWTASERFTTAIEASPEREFVGLYAAHEYGSHAVEPLPTQRPVWMTEWSSGVPAFNPAWDCNGCFGGPDGMYLANDIIQAFSHGNVSAYLYWWAAGDRPAALLETTKDGYTVAKRFYALAAVSRFVQPGAYRVDARTSNPDLAVTAFRNPSGSKVIALLNTSFSVVKTSFSLDPTAKDARVRTFLTDTRHSLAETGAARLEDDEISVWLPRRSLTTICLSPSPVPGTVKLNGSASVERLADGSYEIQIRVENAGPGTAEDGKLDSVKLGIEAAAAELGAGRAIGSLAPGGFTISSINFGAAAGRPGKRVVAKIAGTYRGGSFSFSVPVRLP